MFLLFIRNLQVGDILLSSNMTTVFYTWSISRFVEMENDFECANVFTMIERADSAKFRNI